MIVERYLEWSESAPPAVRAEAAGALARSYLYAGFERSIRDEVEAALVRSLDDPSLGVRCAIADVVAGSADAPQALILALANDAPDVAEPVLARSPLLTDAELVDLVALGGPRAQLAIASRRSLSAPLCAAIAEVGDADACLRLTQNPHARLTRSAATRLATRHGAVGAVRDALLARADLGADLRQILMRSVAAALQAFVVERGWLAPDRAKRAADDACERGALALAGEAADARSFVGHLIRSGEFSTGFALRALLCGRVALFEAALETLSGQSAQRVAGFVRDFEGRGFEALYRQAGFPSTALPVFRAALSAGREFGFSGGSGADAALSRRMVERALTACGATDAPALQALLRRFSTEAARVDARRAYGAPQPVEAPLTTLPALRAA